MAIEPGTYYLLACEKHGREGFAGEESSYRVAESEFEARGLIEDSEGVVMPDGRVFCCECVEHGAHLSVVAPAALGENP